MPSSRKVKPPEDVIWVDIHPDGTEDERRGMIWSPAPALAGMSAFWVLPDEGGEVVLVCRSSRRGPVGRSKQRRVVDLAGGEKVIDKWLPNGGRIVDKGEWFRETDPRSRFASRYVPPTHAPVATMDVGSQVALMLFERLCVDARSVSDFSVSAADVAKEAERE